MGAVKLIITIIILILASKTLVPDQYENAKTWTKDQIKDNTKDYVLDKFNNGTNVTEKINDFLLINGYNKSMFCEDYYG